LTVSAFYPDSNARPDLGRSDEFNRDVRPFLSGRPWTDPDVHVHTQRIQKALQTLLAKACELSSHQVGDVWWSNPKYVSRTALRPLLVLDDVVVQVRI
jgi:hypothetical protein